MEESGENQVRTIETAGPTLARILFGWDGPMWRYRNPWGPWTQGEPPTEPTPDLGRKETINDN